MYKVMHREAKKLYEQQQVLYTGSWEMCETYIRMRPRKNLCIMPVIQ